MKKLTQLLFGLLLMSCKREAQTIYNIEDKKTDSIANFVDIEKEIPSKPIAPILEETFLDSILIGEKGKYKFDLKKFRGDSTYVEIRFFKKRESGWDSVQELTLPKDGVISCDVQLTDFNNDKYLDVTFQSSVAARGANEVRTLLIFDESTGKLRHIKNSQNYPNLQYNAKLDCIDAWAVYGGSTTYFLRIEKDSLKVFASVSSFDGLREVELVDKKNGIRNFINRDKISNEDLFTRYSNYNPLEVANE